MRFGMNMDQPLLPSVLPLYDSTILHILIFSKKKPRIFEYVISNSYNFCFYRFRRHVILADLNFFDSFCNLGKRLVWFSHHSFYSMEKIFKRKSWQCFQTTALGHNILVNVDQIVNIVAYKCITVYTRYCINIPFKDLFCKVKFF